MYALESIKNAKLIAIARGIEQECVPELAGALMSGGIRYVEVTFDHTRSEGIANTIACIRRLKNEKGILVGAGTVISVDEVRLAIDAGAEYIISPNTNIDVIAETKRLGAVSLPGATTPTECQYAADHGADIIKLFPAGALGLEYFKAIIAPLRHLNIMTVGGITPQNLPGFLKAGAVGAGIGSNLINCDDIKKKRYDLIEQHAHDFCRAAGLQ